MFKPKPVFAGWMSDTPETIRQVADYDLKFIDRKSIVSPEAAQGTYETLVAKMLPHYGEMKEIFHYL